jgi:hypothetical protein
MTLVIAKLHSNGVNLIADWRLTRDQKRTTETPNYLNGTLKAWILHPGLCVAYASNDYWRAEKAIRSIGTSSYGNIDLREVLTTLQRSCEAGSEFLVATKMDGPGLWLVRNGAVHPQQDSAWIGDYAAYDKYRELLPSSVASTDPTAPAPIAEFSRMETAFDRLLSDGNIPSVGEIAIAVVSISTGFRYQTRRYLWSPDTTPSEGAQVPFRFGTAAEGAFAVVVIPAETEPAVGMYFPHDRLGAFFFPAQERLAQPVKFQNVTEAEFCARVANDCGVTLRAQRR